MNFDEMQRILAIQSNMVKTDTMAMSTGLVSFVNSVNALNQNLPDIMQTQLPALQQLAEVSRQLNLGTQTEMIASISKSLSCFRLDEVSKIIEEVVAKSAISAIDIAAIKNITGLTRQLGLGPDISKGLSKTLKQLNNETTKGLEKSDLEYCTDDNTFKTKNGSEANAQELNSVYQCRTVTNTLASEELFSDVELVDFMNKLYDNKSFSASYPTGKKIFALIKSIYDEKQTYVIDFDRTFYFHARVCGVDESPFLADQMLRAPAEVSTAGRFNNPGQAHYYFADTAGGAMSEVKKHADKNVKIQIARIRPRKGAHALFIDLSGVQLNGTIFLKCIRKEATRCCNMPRQYLIPQFVADCCKECGFDGIKYYGEGDYSNYVVWRDGLFDFDGMM